MGGSVAKRQKKKKKRMKHCRIAGILEGNLREKVMTVRASVSSLQCSVCAVRGHISAFSLPKAHWCFRELRMDSPCPPSPCFCICISLWQPFPSPPSELPPVIVFLHFPESHGPVRWSAQRNVSP